MPAGLEIKIKKSINLIDDGYKEHPMVDVRCSEAIGRLMSKEYISPYKPENEPDCDMVIFNGLTYYIINNGLGLANVYKEIAVTSLLINSDIKLHVHKELIKRRELVNKMMIINIILLLFFLIVFMISNSLMYMVANKAIMIDKMINLGSTCMLGFTCILYMIYELRKDKKELSKLINKPKESVVIDPNLKIKEILANNNFIGVYQFIICTSIMGIIIHAL